MAEPKTILVVDDEQGVLDLLKITLTRAGYKVLLARNGKEGFARAQGDPKVPDLIISDVMMPVMDGFQMRLALRAIERTRDIPFIFLTAKTSLQDKVIGQDLGARRYLVKPCSHRELLDAVRQALADAEERRRLEALDLASFSGSLEQTSPLCLLDFFRARQWDGQVLLRAGDQEGQLRFAKGELVEVQSAGQARPPALETLLAWREGIFFVERR